VRHRRAKGLSPSYEKLKGITQYLRKQEELPLEITMQVKDLENS